MKRKILLCSMADRILPRFTFPFDKPVQDLKTVCIVTAANVYPADKRSWFDDEIQTLWDVGLNSLLYDLKDQTAAQVEATLQDADVIHVTGGNSYYLLQHMKMCGFASVIRNRLTEGALYIGSSAGAVVTGPSISFVGDLDDAGQATLTDCNGLGLVDFSVMPHVDNEKYKDKIQALMDQANVKLIIGLGDNQALFINDDIIRVIS